MKMKFKVIGKFTNEVGELIPVGKFVYASGRLDRQQPNAVELVPSKVTKKEPATEGAAPTRKLAVADAKK